MIAIFKKMKVLTLALSIIISSGILVPSASQAIVGVCSWNPMLIGAGLVLSSGGQLVGMAGDSVAHKNEQSKSGKFFGTSLFVIGTGAALVGMIVLEDQSTSLEFQAIDNQTQKELKLSDFEVQAFNSELDQVNLLSYQVAYELGKDTKQTPEAAAAAWSKYKEIVSPIVFNTMGKISASVFNN